MVAHSALFVTTVAVTLDAFLTPLSDRLRADGWRVDGLASGIDAYPGLADHFDHLFDATWSRRPLDMDNLRMVDAVRTLVREHAYDVVHVHTPVAALVTRFALRDLRHPPVVIYTAHGFHFHSGGSTLSNAVYRMIESTAAGWTDMLVTINAEDHAAARRFSRISHDRVRLIPGVGVDLDRYRPDPAVRLRVRDALGIDPQRFVGVMVAELNANKRPLLVLDAFAAADPQSMLLIAGEGPLRDAVRERISALGLDERVILLGQREDIPELLAASDVLLLASVREGLPRVVLEAMATQLPVIGTPTRGITDLIDPSVGWIVEPDAAAIARALFEAQSDPRARTIRGSTARERVREHYELGRILASYEELYREALA